MLFAGKEDQPIQNKRKKKKTKKTKQTNKQTSKSIVMGSAEGAWVVLVHVFEAISLYFQ